MAYGGTPGRQLFITFRPGAGQTVIRFEENLKQVAGAYFGGFMGGLGGGTVGVWMGIGMGLLHSVPATIALGATAIGSSYALARGLLRRQFRTRSTELEGLADRLVATIEEGGRRR